MDPSQQFLLRGSPPWLEHAGQYSELESFLHQPPPAPNTVEYLDLARNCAATQVQRGDVWENVFSLVQHPSAMPPERMDGWDEWTTKLIGRILDIIIQRLEPSEDRSKLKRIKDTLKKLSDKTSDIAKRRAQPGSSSEGASPSSDKGDKKLEEVAVGMDKLHSDLAKRDLELTKKVADLIGSVKIEMESTMKSEKPNYLPFPRVIDANFP